LQFLAKNIPYFNNLKNQVIPMEKETLASPYPQNNFILNRSRVDSHFRRYFTSCFPGE